MQPKVSVVMSCYNASKYLAEAVESVVSQTLDDLEIVLVDDGSKDNTLDIINRYSEKDARIVVISKHNTGLTDSLNIGIARCRAKWIARLDADDVAMPTRLEEQISYVQQHPDVVLLGAGFIEIDENGRHVKVQSYPSRHDTLVRYLRTGRRCFPHSSVLFRKDIVSEVGAYRPRILCAEDTDLWLRLSEVGHVGCINKALVKIRKHEDQISHVNEGKTQILHGLAALTCHYLRVHGYGDPAANPDVDAWRQFMAWLSQRAEKNDLYERRREWSRARHKYYGANNQLIGRAKVAMEFALSRHSRRIVLDKLFGSKLAKRVADQWVKDGQDA